MRIEIAIETDNAAFENDPGQEAWRIILNQTKKYIESADIGAHQNLLDINGNKIGTLDIIK